MPHETRVLVEGEQPFAQPSALPAPIAITIDTADTAGLGGSGTDGGITTL